MQSDTLDQFAFRDEIDTFPAKPFVQEYRRGLGHRIEQDLIDAQHRGMETGHPQGVP